MRMAANSEETFLQVARLGLHIFVGLRDHDVLSLRWNLEAYRRAWVEAAHFRAGQRLLAHPRLRRGDGTEAIEEPRENITRLLPPASRSGALGMGRADMALAARRQVVAELGRRR